MHCFRAAQRDDSRIVHCSIQSDHVHLIVEADHDEALSNGMKGCNGRIARLLNALWRRRGRVFRERFHDRVLKTLSEVRNALKYVLNNHRKHGVESNAYAGRRDLDVFSSARWSCAADGSSAGGGSGTIGRSRWMRFPGAAWRTDRSAGGGRSSAGRSDRGGVA